MLCRLVSAPGLHDLVTIRDQNNSACEMLMREDLNKNGKGTNLIWIDLEMTGLDTTSDHIIEVATIITDQKLNIVALGPQLIISQSIEIMDQMDEWNTRHHGESGLTARVLESEVSVRDAELLTLQFLHSHTEPGMSPMCGNSICQDRRFLARLMPDLEAYFHYRNLDVSTLKILAQRWAPNVAAGFAKDPSHRALDDIKDSIEELRFYRRHLINVDGAE